MEEERQQSPLEGLSEEALKHVHQLDEPIPIELQASYFRLSAEMRRRGIQLSENEVQDAEQLLFDPVLSDDIKKMTLLRLAITGNITVFRIIERYLESAPDSMRPWALMAQLEARIGILSDLVDEKQLVITSGLGGRAIRIRAEGQDLYLNRSHFCASFSFSHIFFIRAAASLSCPSSIRLLF